MNTVFCTSQAQGMDCKEGDSSNSFPMSHFSHSFSLVIKHSLGSATLIKQNNFHVLPPSFQHHNELKLCCSFPVIVPRAYT